MKRAHLILLALLLVVSALLVIGCDEGKNRTMIGKILDRSDRYYNKEVVIAGRVTDTLGVDMRVADLGAYRLDDGSGRIWVLTKRGMPERGDEVGLKGRVDGGVRLFGDRFGIVVREYDRRIRHRSDDYYLDRSRDRDRNRDQDWSHDQGRDRNTDRDRDHSYDQDRY